MPEYGTDAILYFEGPEAGLGHFPTLHLATDIWPLVHLATRHLATLHLATGTFPHWYIWPLDTWPLII
jgi:hypothetical protein